MECAQTIYDGFILYNKQFHRITRRARTRFEKRDWKGHQQDIVTRVDLYEKSVRRVVLSLRRILRLHIHDYDLWNEIRAYFEERLVEVPDINFIKTFFNSITRRIFGTIGTDPKLEFIATDPAEDDKELASLLNIRRYPYWISVQRIFETILNDFSFRTPYNDLKKNAARIAEIIHAFFSTRQSVMNSFRRFEFIDSFFYQAARAYLVGRIILGDDVRPLVLAFKNEDGGIVVDAVLLTKKEVSIVFSYTRSYYFADPNSVIGAVHFLHSLLREKPLDELYTILGRLRQGKTERHRIFTQHIKKTSDKFVHAAGEKGLVMIVFTLPSYDLVFKVIRDRFGYPKTISRNDVIEKYRLISKHDRACRLIDTQEFLNLEYPLNRFSDELLDELFAEAAETVTVEQGLLSFAHVYIERRVRPLNLYINEVDTEKARLAIIDYGQAIRDLANTNIFTGDLLLKNFGVTQHDRVIFYDYDEVSLITECSFRDIPTTDDIDDEMRAEAWYYVDNNDIFPEEFIKFLSMNETLRQAFMEYHSDLLTANYWRNIKQKQLSGTVSPVVPYESPALLPYLSAGKKRHDVGHL